MDGDHACNTMKKPFVLQYSTAPCSVVVLVVVVVAPPPLAVSCASLRVAGNLCRCTLQATCSLLSGSPLDILPGRVLSARRGSDLGQTQTVLLYC